MSLNSVLNTALSGLTAAQVSVNVTAHNLANLQTDGFQAGRPVFAETSPSAGGGVQTVAIRQDDSAALPPLSTTNLTRSIIDLSLASMHFRANLEVLEVGDALLHSLSNLERPR